jgi:hypothetical protein
VRHAPPPQIRARTKSGRLSRSYRGPARDAGTPELQAKRAWLVNGHGADPALAASASGILLANRLITPEQFTAGMTYAKLHAMPYGKQWFTGAR